MAVNEVLKALGSWGLQVNSMIPQDIWKSLGYFGHVAIHAGRQDPRVAGDSLLTSARYVGVLREKDDSDATQYTIGGPGLPMWLGDQEGKGAVIEGNLTITSQPLEDAVRLIIPAGTSNILEGTYFNIGGPDFTGSFSWKTQREALNYLTDTLGADWKIDGAGFLHVGLESNLFVVNPVTAVVRRNSGLDMAMSALPGNMHTIQDMNDFTTRVVLLADDGNGGGTATADADIAGGLNPFKDLHGNALRMTRLIQENSTDFSNAAARAQLQLNRFTSTRNGIELSTSIYDIKGDVQVGDYIWVYDPDMDLVDNNNEVIFRGLRMNPMKLRLTELAWPVVQGMSVAYRDRDGAWFDLTDYVVWETGSTTLVVGGFNKALSDGANGGIGTGPVQLPNLTVPAAPTWVTPFLQGSYQSLIDGSTRSTSQLVWTMPANTDASAVTDAGYFEIRYRTSTTPVFPVTHAQMAVFTHQQLHDNGGTEGQPIQYPVTEWQYQRVPADRLSVVVNELTPNMPYEAQVRLVDNAVPANAGDWSILTTWQTADDIIAPSTPAAPEIAAGIIMIQVVHRLGKVSGGTFNLEPDIHHLEIHGQFDPLEPLGDGTRLGRVLANAGMLLGEIPVVGRVPINSVVPLYYRVIAVDNAGNKSQPSPTAVSTALLIDDAHISDLTVSKVTAGTVTAAWVMAGSFVTAFSGPRAGFDNAGFFAEDVGGNVTFDVSSTTGNVYAVGNFSSGLVGERVEINPVDTNVPEIWFSTGNSGRHAYINAIDAGGEYLTLGMNSGESTTNSNIQTSLLLNPELVTLSRNTISPPGDKRGGYFEAGITDVRVGTRDSFSFDTYIRMEKAGGSYYHTGRYARVQTDGGRSADYIDQVGGSGTSASVSYGATMVSTPLPFVEIQGTSGSPPTANAHAVTARSTTGFSIQYPAGNCDIFVWAIRTD